MRYRWTVDGNEIAGELDPAQAAGLGAEALAYYRCERGADRHWGEHTAAEVAALSASGWTCAEGDSWPPEAPTLGQVKTAAIEANRAECTRRILLPLDADPARARDKQISVALGLYGQPMQDYWPQWVAAHLAAENAAADLIEVAVDAAAVAAVVPAWPTWSEPT